MENLDIKTLEKIIRNKQLIGYSDIIVGDIICKNCSKNLSEDEIEANYVPIFKGDKMPFKFQCDICFKDL